MIDFKNIWKISLYEFKKAQSITKRKIVFVTVVLALLIYLSTNFLISSGFATHDAYYTVYTEDDTIKNIISNEDKFLLVDSPDADLIIEVKGQINVFSSNKDSAKAALYNFDRLLKEYNDRVVSNYPIEYAYPVRIDVDMVEREDIMLQQLMGVEQDDSSDAVSKETAEKSDEGQADRESEDGEVDSPSSDDTKEIGEGSSISEQENLEDDLELDQDYFDKDDKDAQVRQSELSLPDKLNPFNQLKTLFLVIFMTIPISMITVVYSNSMMSERMNKRGIFFLVSPVKNFEVIIGKTLPYLLSSFIAAFTIILSATLNIKDILLSSIVVFSFLLIYLAIGFLCAMLARSHKELSFLGIFFISLYTCYLLIPSFMVNFSFISLASPLSILVKIFQQETVGLGLFIFTVVPSLIAGFALFYFSIQLFNDEDMFSYRKIKDKIIDALSYILVNKWNLVTVSFFAIPFVFLIEIMMVVFLMSLRSIFSAHILILLAAFVEEVFRNIGVYTVMSRKLHKLKLKHLVLYSFLAGFGFFLGEKSLMLIMIAPFLEAYATLILSGLILPLLLHSLLTFIFVYVNKRLGRKAFGVSIAITTIIHFSINLTLSLFMNKGA